MNRFSKDDFYFVATLFTLTFALAYVLQCVYDMCVILSNLESLGLAMLAFKPSFTISNPNSLNNQLLLMDSELKIQGLNPGTTADVVVASIFLNRLGL